MVEGLNIDHALNMLPKDNLHKTSDVARQLSIDVPLALTHRRQRHQRPSNDMLKGCILARLSFVGQIREQRLLRSPVSTRRNNGHSLLAQGRTNGRICDEWSCFPPLNAAHVLCTLNQAIKA